MAFRPGPLVVLPRDSLFIELRLDVLTIETRECLLPGTLVSLVLMMEGRPLPLQAPVGECLVTDKDRAGYLYQLRLSLREIPEPDRHLVSLFISKGRGAPALARP